MNNDLAIQENNNVGDKVVQSTAECVKSENGATLIKAGAGVSVVLILAATFVVSCCGVYYKNGDASFSIPKTRLIR